MSSTKPFIDEFLGLLRARSVEIYNEFSLQHELGIHLRSRLDGLKVQFERNISYFGLEKRSCIKREIDIAVFREPYDERTAVVELKFPRSGQYPEQMFSFCRDIAFVEQLVAGGFREGFVLILADDSAFYEGKTQGIYGHFRGGRQLCGAIRKPTGTKDAEVSLAGSYEVHWQPIYGSLRAALISVRPQVGMGGLSQLICS